QNKVLEAMAMGKAVLATPQALEGLDVEHDVHIHEAKTGTEWSEALYRLFEDEPLRERLGQAGRAYVERHHHWDAKLAPLAPLLGLPEKERGEPTGEEAETLTAPIHHG
ncbi:MAG: glycosyltransferase, partial [Pirellulales bacterium]|nr:glycosyltransferase [Pirellulales bacterium]